MLPPWSPYTFSPAVLHDMEARRELARGPLGTTITLPADVPIDLGIAWGRGSMRFLAWPGHAYRLFWLTEGFGAGMGALDTNTGLLHS